MTALEQPVEKLRSRWMELSPARRSPGKRYFSRQPDATDQNADVASLLGAESELLKALKAAQLDSQATHEPQCELYLSPGSQVVEELCWKGTRVVWSKGNTVHNVFDFRDEGVDGGIVLQALFASFRLHQQDVPQKKRKQNRQQASARDQFYGPFVVPAPHVWSDERQRSGPRVKQSANTSERALCVFLRDLLYLYFPVTGETYHIHMPFLLSRAWSMENGLLIERNTHKDEASSSVPVLYSLTDPYDETRTVSTCDSFSTSPLASTSKASTHSLEKATPQGSFSSFLSPYEAIVYCSTAMHGDPHIIVTHNSSDLKVSIYTYQILSEPYTSTSARAASIPQRDDMEEDDLSQFAHGDPRRGLEDLRANTTLAPDKRRVEQSMNIDRMPLDREPSTAGGHAAAADISGDRTQIDHQAEVDEAVSVQSVVWCQKIWERNFDLPKQNFSASIFDSRKGQSTLAIHAQSSSTLFLLRLEKVASSINVVELRQIAALYSVPILATRSLIYDLLIHKPDKSVAFLTADAQERASPSSATYEQVFDALGSTVQVVSAAGTKQLDLHLHLKDRLPKTCIKTLSAVLPAEVFLSIHDVLLQLLYKYPSNTSRTSEMMLLSALLMKISNAERTESSSASKPPWEKLKASRSAGSSAFVLPTAPTFLPTDSLADDSIQVPVLQISAEHLDAILLSLHLIYEDCKLQPARWADAECLRPLLARLAQRASHTEWVDYYLRDGNALAETTASDASTSSSFPETPHLQKTLTSLLSMSSKHSYPDYTDIGQLLGLRGIPSNYFGASKPCPTTSDLLQIYALWRPESRVLTPSQRAQEVVVKLHELRWTAAKVESISAGFALPVKEAIRHCLASPPSNWESSLYSLIGRPDLAVQVGSHKGQAAVRSKNRHLPPAFDKPSIQDACIVPVTMKGKKRAPPPAEAGKKRSFPLPIFVDRRVEEVVRMFHTHRPTVVKAGDANEPGNREDHVGLACGAVSRTLALPTGLSAFTFGTQPPLVSESAAIPDINLTVKVVPQGVIVNLDMVQLTKDKRCWADFHHGVAIALQQRVSWSLDGSDVSFNRPNELDAKHAGYLLGLGLTGQLRSMALYQAFSYLDPKHEYTSIALLLGLSIAFMGTGDAKVTNVLAVHLSALHPSNSSELNLTLLTQSAGLLGLGFLYLGTHNLYMGEMLLRELAKMVVLNMEQAETCRESYALSAGMAYGMIMMGHENKPGGPGDAATLRKFANLIDGTGQHPLPGNKRSAIPAIDINITGPAAIAALSLAFFNTDRADVLAMVELPQTADRLDYYRPDVLLLRTVARCMIAFDSVRPTEAFISSLMPVFVSTTMSKQAFSGIPVDLDIETAYWNILCGACFGIALKYAGTASYEVHQLLLHHVDTLLRNTSMKAPSLQHKQRRHTLRASFAIITLSLSMVFAGTGELQIFRRIRTQYGKIKEDYKYGSHMANSLSIGLLFLGGGKYTLSTSPASIAAMFCAFYPVFPSIPGDNRSHIQAARHLWALAVEPRCLIARDVDSGKIVHMPLKLRTFEPAGVSGSDIRSTKMTAPTLFQEIRRLHSIKVDSARYWPVTLQIADNPDHRDSFVRSQTIFVKRHAGKLDYSQDSQGVRGMASRSGADAGAIVSDMGETARLLSANSSTLQGVVATFSDDPEASAIVRHLAPSGPNGRAGAGDSLLEAFSSTVLLECLKEDKQDMTSLYFALFASASDQHSSFSLNNLRNVMLVTDFYSSLTWSKLFLSPSSDDQRSPLVTRAFIEHLLYLQSKYMASLLNQPALLQILNQYLNLSAPIESGQALHLSKLFALLDLPTQNNIKMLKSIVNGAVTAPLQPDEGQGDRNKAVELVLVRTLTALSRPMATSSKSELARRMMTAWST